MSSNPYSPPHAELDAIAGADPDVALWNPRAAVWWSFFISPLFGTLIHMKNWEVMGMHAEAAKSKQWVIATVVLYGFIWIGSIVLDESAPFQLGVRIAGFAFFVGWYFASGREQVQFVDMTYQHGYARRGWGTPLLYALYVFGALLVAGFIVGVIMGIASPAAP